MFGLNSSSQLHCNTQQHYSPKQVIHGAGVLLAGPQTRRALAARPQKKSPLRFTKPGESLSLESRGSREKGKILAVLSRSEGRLLGRFSCVKSVEGCRSHGSPCGDPGFNSPLDYLSSPRWRLSGASACFIRQRLCKGESEHLSSRINLPRDSFCFLSTEFYSLCRHSQQPSNPCVPLQQIARESYTILEKGGEAERRREGGSAGGRRGGVFLESSDEASVMARKWYSQDL